MSDKKKTTDSRNSLQTIGELTGKTAGIILGRPIEKVGEMTNNDFVTDVGRGVQKATEKTGETVGKLAQGTWDATSGLISKNDTQLEKGCNDITESVNDTVKGVYNSVRYLGGNGKNAVQGVLEKNSEKVKSAVVNVGKVVAVGALAVGIVDLVSDVDVSTVEAEGIEEVGIGGETDSIEEKSSVDPIHWDTRNEDLEGKFHHVTGVYYDSVEVELNDGTIIEGVFPDFEEDYATAIPESMYHSTDYDQFSYANQQLALSIHEDPTLADKFTAEQLEQIENGETPDGYVWHHHEQPGRMELVREDVHSQSGHTGGRNIWGGGSDYR